MDQGSEQRPQCPGSGPATRHAVPVREDGRSVATRSPECHHAGWLAVVRRPVHCPWSHLLDARSHRPRLHDNHICSQTGPHILWGQNLPSILHHLCWRARSALCLPLWLGRELGGSARGPGHEKESVDTEPDPPLCPALQPHPAFGGRGCPGGLWRS